MFVSVHSALPTMTKCRWHHIWHHWLHHNRYWYWLLVS